MAVYDLVLILIASIASAAFSEGISWVLIYRTETYNKAKATVERLTKKLEKKKAEVVGQTPTKQKQMNKKIERYDESLKAANKDMSFNKMKSMFGVGITMIALFGFLGSVFEGRPVARLPFEPFSLIRGLTHRGLPGTDYYDCSMAFFYVLCSMSIRANLQKYLGFLPRGANTSFFQPPEPPK